MNNKHVVVSDLMVKLAFQNMSSRRRRALDVNEHDSDEENESIGSSDDSSASDDGTDDGSSVNDEVHHSEEAPQPTETNDIEGLNLEQSPNKVVQKTRNNDELKGRAKSKKGREYDPSLAPRGQFFLHDDRTGGGRSSTAPLNDRNRKTANRKGPIDTSDRGDRSRNRYDLNITRIYYNRCVNPIDAIL